MLNLNFPSNFVSAIPRLNMQWVGIYTQGSSEYTIAEIYKALQSGQDFYRSQKYQDAIREYKRAQSMAYQLLNPQHSIDMHLADDRIMLPVGNAIEAQIADVSLKLAESMRRKIVPSNPPAAVVGAVIPNELQAFQQLGFQIEGVPSLVSAKIAQGAQLINSGNPDQAAEILTEAINLLGTPTDAAKKAALADAYLNLSSAQLALGYNLQGQTSAQRAYDLFQATQDDIGTSQALHNQAVALSKLGKSAEANVISSQATRVIARVDTQLTATMAAPVAQAATSAAEPTAPATGAPTAAATSSTVTVAPSERMVVTPRTSRTVAAIVTPVAIPATPVTAAPVAATLSHAEIKISAISLKSLQFIASRDVSTVSIRYPGALGESIGTKLPDPNSPAARESWSLGLQVGDAISTLVWVNGQRPSAATLLKTIGQPRVQAKTIAELSWHPTGLGEAASYLTHVYAFVLPQSLGDSYHAIGDFDRAQQYYMQAAQYTYLNPDLEAASLWSRVAHNILEWGDSLYRNEKIPEAKSVYSNIILQDGSPAIQSDLFKNPALAKPAAEAKAIIQNPQNAAPSNPAIAYPILTLLARWQYLNAGLDFFGTSFTPVFTFEYLQQVARSFAEQSIGAEREYVNFQTQSENEAATRRELQGSLALAQAQVEISKQQLKSSQADTQASQLSVGLANLRANNAAADRNAYATAGYWQYITQSIAAAHGQHEDWYQDEISRLAADMEKGSWSGNPGKLTAAATLLGGQKSYEYQLGRLDRTINEMNAMVPIAQAQLAAAKAREQAAALSLSAAETRVDLTADALAAFESEVFTPELWAKMAQVMREISSDYQYWAIRMAKLMQRAYNFETDDSLNVIKSTYSPTLTQGLLGSEYLMKDIDSFTYYHITHTLGKTMKIKEVISLANEFPFQFYTLQRTGKTTFETTLLDFDHRNPGFFLQRLAAVEVEMLALMPPGGVHGYLRSGSISKYRNVDGTEKFRIHTSDTLALSEFTIRGDAFLFRGDPTMHGLFEGHGLGGTWELALPKRSNNLDYRLITDVRLIFYYTAQFDPQLRDLVLSKPPEPGEMIHTKKLQPRWDFPESWYSFLGTAHLDLNVSEDYFPRNETNLKTDKIFIQVITRNQIPADNIDVTLTLPQRPSATLTSNAEGITETQPGNAFDVQMAGPVIGPWSIQIQPKPGSPLLDNNGQLKGDLIDQVIIIIQYSFDWPT